MTAPDPRLGEIEARRDPEGCTAHDNCLRSDVAYLLAELRKATRGPDCGTTLSKRTPEAIALRLGKVSDGPWTAWDRGIGYEVHGPHGEPINMGHRETFTRGDAEFIAAAPADVAYLLAELRKAQDALGRVEGLHFAEGDADHSYADICFECRDTYPCPTIDALRAAVAAATGDR